MWSFLGCLQWDFSPGADPDVIYPCRTIEPFLVFSTQFAVGDPVEQHSPYDYLSTPNCHIKVRDHGFLGLGF